MADAVEAKINNLKFCKVCEKKVAKTTYYRLHYNGRCKVDKSKILLPPKRDSLFVPESNENNTSHDDGTTAVIDDMVDIHDADKSKSIFIFIPFLS